MEEGMEEEIGRGGRREREGKRVDLEREGRRKEKRYYHYFCVLLTQLPCIGSMPESRSSRWSCHNMMGKGSYQTKNTTSSTVCVFLHSVIAVGGDGLFNEVLNGLLIQTQNQSGVNLRRSRFIPVTPSIRVGVIPTGFNNSICRSVFGCKSPFVAAAQIMLGMWMWV